MLQRHYMNAPLVCVCVCVCVSRQALLERSLCPSGDGVCLEGNGSSPRSAGRKCVCECPYSTFAAVSSSRTTVGNAFVCVYTHAFPRRHDTDGQCWLVSKHRRQTVRIVSCWTGYLISLLLLVLFTKRHNSFVFPGLSLQPTNHAVVKS